MKRLASLILIAAFILPAFAQEDTIQNSDILLDTPEKTQVKIGQNEIFIIEDDGDTTRFQLGSKGMSIVEDVDGYKIDIVEMDDDPNPILQVLKLV